MLDESIYYALEIFNSMVIEGDGMDYRLILLADKRVRIQAVDGSVDMVSIEKKPDDQEIIYYLSVLSYDYV